MEASSSPFSSLRQMRTILLTTYRKSGEGVSTPIWFADQHGVLYLYTSASAGKVKRLRHTTRITLAPCTFNGRVTGPAIEARARIITDEGERQSARKAIYQKYWFQRRALAFVEGITGLFSRKKSVPAVYIAIEPVQAS